MKIIQVNELTKKFTTNKKAPGLAGAFKGLFYREKINVKAVDNISFGIEQGEIVGFLGPNGAGKTTTLKMLAGILYPTSGNALISGFIPWERKDEFKKMIGIVMGQKNQLVWDLPAEDSFELFKEIYEIPDKEYKEHLARLTNLLKVKNLLNIQVRNLSLGERMKMEIIAALLHKPKILFLDEPTIGLDVVSQKNIRDFFSQYNQEEKTTILLTSHYMEDIKALCERVIIIDKGKIIYDDMLSDLLQNKINTKIIKIKFNGKSPGDKFGEIVKENEGYIEYIVPSIKAVETTEKILKEVFVEDIAIEDPEAGDIIREIFTKNRN